MNNEIINEIEALGGDAADSTWRWLLNTGPHGKNFTWSQTKKQSPGYVGVEHLAEIVDEKIEADSSFRNQALKVVRMALESSNTNILIRAIQIGAVLGEEKELITISSLTKHQDDLVVAHAKASYFYLKKHVNTMRR